MEAELAGEETQEAGELLGWHRRNAGAPRRGQPGTVAFARPLRVAATLAVAIFVLEAVLLILTAMLPPLPPLAAGALDAGILTAAILPLLYLLLYRPLAREVAERKRAGGELWQLREELERKVAERVAQDIADKRAAEQALCEQKELCESLIQNSAVATFVLNSRHEVMSWNRACEELTGVPAGRVVGTTEQWKAFSPNEHPCLADLVIEGGLDKARDRYEVAGRSSLAPDGLHAEGWYRNLGGKDRYLVFDAAPIRNATGEVVAAIETLQDITARRRAEEEAQRSLSLLSSTLESTADGISVVDTSGRIVMHNRRFAELWRVPEDIVAGRDDRSMLSIALAQLRDPSGFLKKLAEMYSKPEAESSDVLEFTDGRIFQCVSLPQRLNGAPVGRVWCYRDVTHEAKLEQQLRQSQKLEALGTLAGGIAHDFNNILTAILGYAELVEDDLPAEGAAHSNLARVLAAGERARDLVRRILAFSRSTEPGSEVIRMSDVVDDALKLVRAGFPAAIELRCRTETAADLVRGDATQLHQVLMNLCTNGAQAMKGEGGVLTVVLSEQEVEAEVARSHPQLSSGSCVRIAVSDTGCGMTKEVMERIFEPFFTTKPPGEGTGLGLSAVHGIVKSHGGTIAVSSEPGQGTTFRIYLPKAEGCVTPRASAEEDVPGGTERILFVDDEEAIQALGRALLEGLGYRVRACSNAIEALEEFQADPKGFDLLITDYSMPKMTGAALARKVRELRPEVPVIVCTGFSRTFEPGLAGAGDIRELLIKPVTRRDLAVAARNALDGR